MASMASIMGSEAGRLFGSRLTKIHRSREAGTDPSDDNGDTDDSVWLDTARAEGIASRNTGSKKC